jgi:MerC mercury resistance protein
VSSLDLSVSPVAPAAARPAQGPAASVSQPGTWEAAPPIVQVTEKADTWTAVADRVAIALSAVCAVHCAVTPVLLAVMPFLGSAAFETGMRLVLSTLGVCAIGFGALVHRSLRSLPFLAVALLLFGLLAARHDDIPHEELVSVIASLFLVAAHWTNLRTARECRSHSHA